MIPAERQALILSRLSQTGVMSIAQLADILEVSQMTIRRDIHTLEDEGRAISVAGGVQLPEKIFNEPSHNMKVSICNKEKVAIGFYAARLVKPGSTIFLDAGTTTLEIAHCLKDLPNITVVTNDFVICNYLAQNSQCKLFHTGGEVERENQSCIGYIAGDVVQQFNFDYGFLSTSSFARNGISTPSESKIAIKRKVIQNSINRYLVTDSSKYGLIGTFNIIPLNVLTAVITDSGLVESAQETITQLGIKLHLVDVK